MPDLSRDRKSNHGKVNDNGATWMGGGAVAAIAVPIVAALCLALGQGIGLPVGDLLESPTAMIVLWGPVFGVMLVAPVAFVLGALAFAARNGGSQW